MKNELFKTAEIIKGVIDVLKENEYSKEDITDFINSLIEYHKYNFNYELAEVLEESKKII